LPPRLQNLRLTLCSSGGEKERSPQAPDQGSTVDDREELRRAGPRIGAHDSHGAQARYRFASTQSGADRAKNFVQLPNSCQWV